MAATRTTRQPQAGYSYAVFIVLAGLVAGELFWFGLLYPLIPKTAVGWLVGAIVGAGLGIWAGASALLIDWLQHRTRFQPVFKILAAVVAVSLGVAIFWLAQGGQAFIVANFSYFGR